MTQKRQIHGHWVMFEENAKPGIHYLEYELQAKEALVFFDQAKQHGSAEFEDSYRHNFTLSYYHDGYTLVRR